jgi:hypothetical protein
VSDQRFERDIRDALMADDPGAVPGRLRTRIAAIPDETPRRDARPMRAIGLLAAAAVVIAAVAIAGLSQRGVTVGPPASTSPSGAVPSGSAAAASPSASASTEPGANDPTGPINVAAGDVKPVPLGVFAIRDGKAFSLTVEYGPTVSSAISSVDIATGATTKLAAVLGDPPPQGPVLSANRVIWIQPSYAKPPMDCGNQTPCNRYAGQPVLWKIVAVPLDGGPVTTLTSGSSARTSFGGELPAPMPPVIAADGDRFAYAIDAPTASAPEASQIIVRSISTGAIVRQIDTIGYVEHLALSGRVIAYLEGFDTAGPGTVAWGDSALMLARTDAETPARIEDHVIDVALGDGRIAWNRVGEVDDSVWTASLDNLQPERVLGPVRDVPIPEGQAGLSSGLTIAGAGLAWSVPVPDAPPAWTIAPVLWRPGEPRARQLTGVPAPSYILAGGGLLGFTESDTGVAGGAVLLASLWGAP